MNRESPPTTDLDKAALYAHVLREARALLASERDAIANLANLTALIFERVPRLNWAGFYLWKRDELVLGPFQGRAACTRIALGRGVCGTAAERRASIVVPDVTQFPGHIACDSASRSEIVIPILLDERLFGVLDLDSPDLARFDETDRAGLEALLEVLADALRNASDL